MIIHTKHPNQIDPKQIETKVFENFQSNAQQRLELSGKI